MMLAQWLMGGTEPEQIGRAQWLLEHLEQRITTAVAAGIGQAFAKK